MRIISKFHDYYDSAIGYGIDEAVTYVRKTVEFDRNDMRTGYEPQRFKNIEAACNKINVDLKRVAGSLFEHIFLGFCGKIYVGLQYTAKPDDLRVPVPDPGNKRVFPAADSYYPTEYVQMWVEKDLSSEELLKQRGGHSRWRWGCENVAEWFEVNQSRLVTENIDVFAENDCVAFVFCGRQMVIEPRLIDWNFQRRIDSFTAFQEISMFISGVIGSPDQRQPEPISDELRAHTKGFNKQSFRKDPTKRK